MKTLQISNPFILAITARNLTVEIHQHSAYQIVLSNERHEHRLIKELAH